MREIALPVKIVPLRDGDDGCNVWSADMRQFVAECGSLAMAEIVAAALNDHAALQAQVAALEAERDEARTELRRVVEQLHPYVTEAALPEEGAHIHAREAAIVIGGLTAERDRLREQVAAVRGLLPRWIELAEVFASDPGAGERTAGATTAVRAAVRKLAAIVGDAGEGVQP